MGFFVFGFTSSCVNSPVILLFEGKGSSIGSSDYIDGLITQITDLISD